MSGHIAPSSSFDAVPDWMRHAKRWLLWKLIPHKDPKKKPRKVPFYVSGKLRTSEGPDDTAALATFEDAVAVLAKGFPRYAGLGFALGQDEGDKYWQGIDLDNFPAHPHLAAEVDGLPGYVEYSPSGAGVHAIGLGTQFPAMPSDGSGVEAYSTGRFFTVTGRAIRDSGPVDLIEAVRQVAVHRRPAEAVEPAAAANDVDWACVFELTAERERDLRSALAYLDSEPRDLWVRVAYALKGGGENVFPLFDEWSARAPNYEPEEARRLWNSAKPTRTGPGAVFKLATERGWANPRQVGRAGLSVQSAANDPEITSFKFKAARELIDEVAAPNFIVDSLIEAGAIGMLYGEPGVGKSFVAIDWGASVATGKSWHGRQVVRGPVFLIAGEGHAGLGRRLAAWEIHSDVRFGPAEFYVSEAPAGLMDAENAHAVAAAVEQLAVEGAPSLVIIDTLNRNLGAGDENSAQDIAAFLTNVDIHIRKRFGTAVLIVHHSGHATKTRARGSSAIHAAMDFVLHLEGEGDVIKLSVDKQKDSEPVAPIYLDLLPIELDLVASARTGSSQVVVQASPPGTKAGLASDPLGRLLLESLDDVGAVDQLQQLGVQRAATVEKWRSAYAASRADENVLPDSIGRAFSRAKTALAKRGLISQHEGWVWPADDDF